jgi:hypothetical protein
LNGLMDELMERMNGWKGKMDGWMDELMNGI